MSMYHVKADGAMGACKAQEGHCPFGGDAGVKHFTSITEARSYAEELIRDTTKGGMNKMTKTKDEEPTTPTPTDDDEPRMTKNTWGLKVTTWPTERGVHSATYLGWGGDDDYEIVSAGGWVDGTYIPSHEVYSAGLFAKLSTEVRDEMESLDGPGTGGATPAEWNGKILELEKKGVSPEDEALLDALWIEAESFEGSVTIYGPDDDVAEMDEDDLERYGLRRMDADELWRYGVLVDDDEDEDDEEEDE